MYVPWKCWTAVARMSVIAYHIFHSHWKNPGYIFFNTKYYTVDKGTHACTPEGAVVKDLLDMMDNPPPGFKVDDLKFLLEYMCCWYYLVIVLLTLMPVSIYSDVILTLSYFFYFFYLIFLFCFLTVLVKLWHEMCEINWYIY